MLSKDQLIFDPTAASTAECDTVGAHLLDGDGNKITSTGGALDVNIASGTLDASGSVVALDAATLAALEDVTATVSGTVALDAATLAALEDVNATVTATDLDIRDLTAATDTVAIGDGTETLAINPDGSINVSFSPTGKQNVVETNNGCAHSAVSVSATAAPLVATALASRTTIHIQNLGSQAIFIGCDNSVTATNGTRVPKGGSAEFKFNDSVNLHAITSTGTADVRVIELACT